LTAPAPRATAPPSAERRSPAAVRFLSLEPRLGPLPSLDLTGIDWGDSWLRVGPKARPMHPEWARDVRYRCADTRIAFHFKWGEWALSIGPKHPGSTTASTSAECSHRHDSRTGDGEVRHERVRRLHNELARLLAQLRSKSLLAHSMTKMSNDFAPNKSVTTSTYQSLGNESSRGIPHGELIEQSVKSNDLGRRIRGFRAGTGDLPLFRWK
jgi:Protein of unknown function (DUF5131)